MTPLGILMIMLVSTGVAALSEATSDKLRGTMLHTAEGLIATFASEAAGNPVWEFLWFWKGTILFCTLVVLSTLLSHFFKQQPGEGVADTDVFEKGNVWHNKGEMLQLLRGKTTEQTRMRVDFWPIFMNRPWHTEDQEDCVWGGIKAFCPNKEWMNDMAFPNGETRTDHPWQMIKAFWHFMITRTWDDTRTCVIISVLQGLVGPIAAQIFCWILDEVGTGNVRSTASPLASLPGNAHQILLLWCILLVLLHAGNARLAWMFDMAIPGGGTRRQFKLRLQRQFVAMKGEKAEVWPAGRCQVVIDSDAVIVVNQVFHAIYKLANYGTGCIAIVSLTIFNNRHELMSMVSWMWIFLFLFAGSFLDISSRLGHIQDMAMRDRQWSRLAGAMVSRQIQDSRQQVNDDDIKELVEEGTFIEMYRHAHSYFFGFGAKMACQLLNYTALGIVAYAAGTSVMDGHTTLGQATVLMLCIQLLAGVQSNLVVTVVELLQAYPSLVIVAEVLNTPVD